MENLLEQVDSDRWKNGVQYEIVSLCSVINVVIQRLDDTFSRANTIAKPVINTKGWDVQVQWANKLADWVPLITIKEFNPVEVADHAVANG